MVTSVTVKLTRLPQDVRTLLVGFGSSGPTVQRASGAMSDGAQSLYPAQFEALMGALRPVAAAVGRSL